MATSFAAAPPLLSQDSPHHDPTTSSSPIFSHPYATRKRKASPSSIATSSEDDELLQLQHHHQQPQYASCSHSGVGGLQSQHHHHQGGALSVGPSCTSSSDPKPRSSKRLRKLSSDGRPQEWLYKYLQVLDHAQLVKVLMKIPHDLWTGLLDKPTVANVEGYLLSLEKRLYEAFPYHKGGLQNDDYSFNRIRMMLMEFQDALLEFAAYFETSGDIYTTSCYLALATRVAFRLPDWKSEKNAQGKRELLIKLSGFWRRSIQQAVHKTNNEGRMWGEAVVMKWWREVVEFEERGRQMYQQQQQQQQEEQQQERQRQEQQQEQEQRQRQGGQGPPPGASSHGQQRAPHSQTPHQATRPGHVQHRPPPVPPSTTHPHLHHQHHHHHHHMPDANSQFLNRLMFSSTRRLIEQELGWMMSQQARHACGS